MAEQATMWLVRRAERQYASQLGQLRHGELSWYIAWRWLPGFVVAGFVVGIIAQFTGSPTSSRDPGLFYDIPLFVLVSLLTGLMLWSLTLFWSFRRLLVFDRGLLYRYSQKHTARAIFWEDIDPGSLRAVVSADGKDADHLLKTLNRADKEPLGVHGRFAVVFRGSDSVLTPGTPQGNSPQPRFFTFSSRNSPDELVRSIQQGLADAGVPEAGSALHPALPPTLVSSVTSLD
ncbi:hypothetical protein [Pseudarthrobacter sp. N5]|uniref:hypothetical protein n=1 Tax=Pseudarthrobacter sp. N5 TaxID=3418416 RepID=UPI003CF8A109